MHNWEDIKTAPKDGRIFFARAKDLKEFVCQFAPIPDGLGYYGYLRLLGYVDEKTPHTIVEAFPLEWREYN